MSLTVDPKQTLQDVQQFTVNTNDNKHLIAYKSPAAIEGKGWYYTYADFSTGTFYLSKTQPDTMQTPNVGDSPSYIAGFNSGFAVGDVVTYINDEAHTVQITNVDGNRITVGKRDNPIVHNLNDSRKSLTKKEYYDWSVFSTSKALPASAVVFRKNELSNFYFEDALDEVYSYVKGHLINSSYQVDVLKSVVDRCVEDVYPDVKPDVEQELEYYSYNQYKATIPRNDTGSVSRSNVPKLKGNVAKELRKQDVITIQQQKALISALFSNARMGIDNGADTTMGVGKEILSESLLCAHLFDVTETPDVDDMYTIKSDISAQLLLNTIQTFESNYSIKRPKIIQSNYVLNKLKELVRSLSNVRIFNYNVYFKKTAYSGKIYYQQFLTTAEALYKWSEIHETWGIGGVQYMKDNLLISPYVRQFNEANSGVFIIYNEADDYHLQQTNSENNIQLKDDIRFIYTTDETSDIPTFDFSTQFGSNGNFTFYKTIQTEKSNLEELIDLSIFNIAKGEQICVQDIVQAIYYIFRMWIENIKTYYFSLFICHSNCHNNNVLEDASGMFYSSDIVYIQCPEYGPYAKIIWHSYSPADLDNPGDFQASTKKYTSAETNNDGILIYGALSKDLEIRAKQVDFFDCDKVYVFRSTSFPAIGMYDSIVINALPPGSVKKSELLPSWNAPARNGEAPVDQNVDAATIAAANSNREARLKKYQSTVTASASRAFGENAINVFGSKMYQVAMGPDPENSTRLLATIPHPVLNFAGKNEAGRTAEFNNVIKTGEYLYCLDILDTMYVKLRYNVIEYEYTVNYYSGGTLLKGGIKRSFRVTDLNNHMYFVITTPYADGERTRPCIVVTVSDIDKWCRYNIDSIDIECWYNDSKITTYKDITIGQILANNMDVATSNILTTGSMLRKYYDGHPWYDKIRRWTEREYPFGKSGNTTIQYYYQLYYTLLDAYSFDSPFYKCGILHHAVGNIVPKAIIPETISSAKCGRNEPATRKYAILPINNSKIAADAGVKIGGISLGKKGWSFVVNVKCSL